MKEGEVNIIVRPIISIITPIYNLKNYIERCIQSVINQTFKAWEYILVGGGSTDKFRGDQQRGM